MHARFLGLLAALCLVALAATPAAAQPSYLLFESGQVRPLALSPDGTRLFAVNTPDNRLEIFDVGVTGELTQTGSVAVGMEPVAVAARTNSEVWVVNFLSDSVSIVDLSGTQPRVIRTLHVGDEPSDIVFAGTAFDRAFITTAHRGQNSPNGGRINRTAGQENADDQSGFDTPGQGRADVWVFDSGSLGSELGGTALTVITLFGDKPRAIAASANGASVYAAVLHSGNQTTVLGEGHVCDTSAGNLAGDATQPACTLATGESSAGGTPPPHQNHEDEDRPEVGIIVKKNRDGVSPTEWQDELGRDWAGMVRFDLPDRDVFEIDANANPPVAVDGSSTCVDGAGCWAGVGTTLFNMAVHPNTGKIYVTNSEAQNHVRFEGPGTYATGIKPGGEPTTVQGNLAQMRITVLDGANVDPRHLNKHINYATLPAPAGTADDSLATPLGMAFDDGGTAGTTVDDVLYVAAFGSRKIGIFDVDALDADTFTPSSANHIELSGGGPAGVLFQNGMLYVLTRFDNSIAVIDTTMSNAEVQKLALYNPEPASVVEGRKFLYDARLTSSNGEASCASCHIFGDLDHLAWNLGNPDDDVVANGNPFNTVIGPGPLPLEFHPSKGPMTTQSLRGLDNMGPQHWRGDRQGDENAAFTAFNVAFPGLVGRGTELTPSEMADFTEFALQLRYPPNPIRKLDNSLRPDEQAGFVLYGGPTTDSVANCNGCHTLNPVDGFFGGNGESTFDAETQHFKVPHLRNMYQKVGMFGTADAEAGGVTSQFLSGAFIGDPSPFGNKGDQIRGFGYNHDGAIDTLFRFNSSLVFSINDTQRDQLQSLMAAFFTDLAPIVGQQVTLHSGNTGNTTVTGRIDLMETRAGSAFNSEILGGTVTDCDVIAHLVQGGTQQAGLYDPGTDTYQPDDGGAPIPGATVRSLANTAGQEVTYTCVPPGSGNRLALDRDEDLLFNGVETGTGVFVSASDTGTDPALKDTDGDGFEDGDEVINLGSDPNDPNDPNFKVPSAGPPALALLAWFVLGTGVRRARRSAQA